jgi:hypothetical protein
MKRKRLDISTYRASTDSGISYRILVVDSVRRAVLIWLRADQRLYEHGAKGLVTVYPVRGKVFSMKAKCCDMVPGT